MKKLIFLLSAIILIGLSAKAQKFDYSISLVSATAQMSDLNDFNNFQSDNISYNVMDVGLGLRIRKVSFMGCMYNVFSPKANTEILDFDYEFKQNFGVRARLYSKSGLYLNFDYVLATGYHPYVVGLGGKHLSLSYTFASFENFDGGALMIKFGFRP